MKRFLYKAFAMVLAIAICVGVLSTKPILAAAPFSDIPGDSWAVQVIESAVNNGLMSGMGDDLFGYGATITRAQFATILGNMFGWGNRDFLSASHGFRDVSVDDWFHDVIENALRFGIIDHSDMFFPNAPILRQDMAVMLVRALGYSSLAQQVERFEAMPFF